jgi:hypothetical protein
MNTSAQSKVQSSSTPSFTPAPLNILQRKCACGGSAGLSGECAGCQKEKLVGENVALVQPQLKISQPNDKYEQEADRVADEVMRMPELEVQRQVGVEEEEDEETIQTKRIASQITPLVQRQSVDGEAAEEDEELIQTKTIGHLAPEMTPAISTGIQSMQSGGRPLSRSERNFFEPRFGADFSNVRVHNDTRAASAARSVNARAFTLGHNVVFGDGEYSPNVLAGRKLLAHELTHDLQQNGRPTLYSKGKNSENTNPHEFSIELPAPKTSDKKIMRKGFDSTIEICHRVLESRQFKITKGGLRVVLLLNDLDKNIPNCHDFGFGVTLTQSVGWWPDDEIATCKASTGGARSFSFANLSPGTYYLTIWRNFDHPYCCLTGDIIVFDEAVSNDSTGCTRDKDPSVMDIVHGALDIAGFIPVLGAIPDGVNALIYVVEGDWVNAGISTTAMVPVFGDAAKAADVVVKGGKKIIKASGKTIIKKGKDELATGLKKVAAAKLEKEAAERAAKKAAEETAAREAAEKAAKEKTGKEGAEKVNKKAVEKKKKKKKKKRKECSEVEKAALNAALHIFCDKPRSCSMQGDTCESATAKVAAGYGCVDGRTKLQQKCFTPDDPGYENHMIQIAQANAALRRCIPVMTAKCK